MQRNNIFLSILLTAFSVFLILGTVFSQEPVIKQYLLEGSNQQAKGNYEKALEYYNQALLLDSKHDQGHYLMATAYFDFGKYNEAVIHCDKAIHPFSAYQEEAFMLRGKALLKNGKTKDAVQNYNKMLSEYPENYLTNYYVGLSYYKLDDYSNAELALANALYLQPTHAESHLLLGNMMTKKGERLKSVMAYVNFLLIEPRGERSVAVFTSLHQQMSKGFDNIGDNILSISMAADANIDQFSSADAMNSFIENGSDKDLQGQFIKNTSSLFSKLATMKKESNFWWEFYVHFYNDMNYDNHIQTLSYFISQSQSSDDTQEWLANNNQKVTSLIDWVNSYER